MYRSPPTLAFQFAILLVSIAAAFSLAACDQGKDERPPEQLWDEVCSTCHGKAGEGLRHKLGKSIDMRKSSWQEGKTDDEITSIIKDGKVGSRRMPAFGKRLDDEQIKGLIKIIRKLPENNKRR